MKGAYERWGKAGQVTVKVLRGSYSGGRSIVDPLRRRDGEGQPGSVR